MRKVNIIDYGSGNIGSLVKSLQHLGLQPVVSSSRQDVIGSSLAFFPGVGHAQHAIARLRATGLYDLLIERHSLGRPLVGICLGAQLFLDYVTEADSRGLGFVNASTAPLESALGYNNGWFSLNLDELRSMGLANDLRPGDSFYFNHSYFIPAASFEHRASVLGQPNTTGVFFQDYTVGIQFHPEKSQKAGEIILRNILKVLDAQ